MNLKKKAVSRFGAGNVQDKPGASHHTKKQESYQKLLRSIYFDKPD